MQEKLTPSPFHFPQPHLLESWQLVGEIIFKSQPPPTQAGAAPES